jgi:glycosyltransferase involved in cell wall biosynthesis
MVLERVTNNKMKILIYMIRWKGGVGSVISEIKSLLEKEGHEVKIISREDDLKLFSTKDSFFKIREIIKNTPHDILYTQDWSCALPLLFYKNNFICFHGEDPNTCGKFFQNLVGKIKGKKLIVVGDKLKKIFPESNLIYNGVNLQKFKSNPKIKRIKNSVGFANWTTEVYNFKKIERAVKDVGKKFFVAEGVAKEKMSEFYSKIELFISFPPKYTGFNLVWIEAMACGVPKIIGNNNGIGWKLPITKIEDYKGDIEKAILNAEKRDYRRWILENNFTWEKSVDKLINTFEENIK